tara:strand:+ start:8349 stop:8861 length:513 start_codon:yes stop_codon:yes gene_type:complete
MASPTVTLPTPGGSSGVWGTTLNSAINTINAELRDATTTQQGLMTSTDKSKLDNIETNAKDDQTGAEIKSLYEAESDTNALTDALLTKVNDSLTANQSITFSGDATGSGTTAVTLTHSNSGVSAGTYGTSSKTPQITVDAKGRVTSVSNVDIDNVNIAEGVALSLSIALG